MWRRKPKQQDPETRELSMRVLAAHKAELAEAKATIQWLLRTAPQEQVIAWAADAARHLPDPEPEPGMAPDWEARVKDILTNAFGEILILRAENDELKGKLAAK